MGFAEDMKGMRADAILVHSSHRRGGGTARVARGGGGWALYDLLRHRTSGTYEEGGVYVPVRARWRRDRIFHLTRRRQMQPGEGEGIERDSAETERRRRRRRENQGAPLSPPALLPLTHVGFELEDFVDADLNCGFRGIDVGKLVDFFFFYFDWIRRSRRRRRTREFEIGEIEIFDFCQS